MLTQIFRKLLGQVIGIYTQLQQVKADLNVPKATSVKLQ